MLALRWNLFEAELIEMIRTHHYKNRLKQKKIMNSNIETASLVWKLLNNPLGNLNSISGSCGGREGGFSYLGPPCVKSLEQGKS